jgi:hypothetical protein
MESLTRAHTFERYEVGAEIGSGAIAAVVRVRDTVGGGTYAAKLLHPRHERDATARARFQREAELASRLVHPNLVRVWGIDTIAGRTALVMELVEGSTLARFVAKKGVLPEPELLALAEQIAAGLAYAHSCGVIHRDLKPANVLLTFEGERPLAKIADFGMARASSFADADKGALTVLGTPPYMAPECLDPLAVDPRTDLYAFGCMLFELATGAPPYSGPTPFAMLEAHRSAEIPPLPAGYSSELRKLVKRLLAKTPGERPQSAGAVMAVLAELAGDPTRGALVAVTPGTATIAAVTSGRCAGCGAPVLSDVAVCFRCGLAPIVLEPGPCAVLVTGPGRVSDKLDSTRRDRLVDWLRANQSVGLDPSPLASRIPRLPFVLVTDVSSASAHSIVASLARLELAAESRHGSAMGHPLVRKHANRMAKRGLAVAAAVAYAPALVFPLAMVVTMPIFVVAVIVVFAISYSSAGRTVVKSQPAAGSALPPGLAQRLRALPPLVAGIRQARHRDALGAVVLRVVTLTRATPSEARHEISAEMEHAVNLATVAAQRMDEIESMMQRADFDPAHAEHRASMQERDMWAARLLELTATLDALAVRHAAAGASLGLQRADLALGSLRATVEALEEVQRL